MNVQNKKAYFEYFIKEKYEAGIVLEGWEIKAIRANKVSIQESYVVVKDGEVFLFGCHVTPLITASTHVKPDPTRTRKLLLKKSEINRLIGSVEREGYTLVPLNMHFSRGKLKVEIALAKGKKLHDKRQTIKERDWNREQRNLCY